MHAGLFPGPRRPRSFVRDVRTGFCMHMHCRAAGSGNIYTVFVGRAPVWHCMHICMHECGDSRSCGFPAAPRPAWQNTGAPCARSSRAYHACSRPAPRRGKRASLAPRPSAQGSHLPLGMDHRWRGAGRAGTGRRAGSRPALNIPKSFRSPHAGTRDATERDHDPALFPTS